MTQARAAVLRQIKAPMTIETIDVEPLAPGDVLVRIRAASLCHTDREAIEGALGVPLAAVLGMKRPVRSRNVVRRWPIARWATGWCCRGTHIAAACFYRERALPILCRRRPRSASLLRCRLTERLCWVAA